MVAYGGGETFLVTEKLGFKERKQALGFSRGERGVMILRIRPTRGV